MSLSRRAGPTREASYCYPNILASIQPDILSRHADALDLASGFLPRFLITRAPSRGGWRPRSAALTAELQRATDCLKVLTAKSGGVNVPDRYLQDVLDEFIHSGAHFPSHYGRLVNEYGARFAVVLSVHPDDLGSAVELRPEHWEGAAVHVRWFYGMAEKVFGEIQEDSQAAHLEKMLKKFFLFIRSNVGCRLSDVSHRFSRGTVAWQRRDYLSELEERGLVRTDADGRFHVIRVPPEWDT